MTSPDTKVDIAVIGAGASGIMAALTAARAGRRVVLLDKNPGIGRKLLATGNGRCNLTNATVTPDRYHGAPPAFVKAVLAGFDQTETIHSFGSIGVKVKEEDRGRIFPVSDRATSVVDALGRELSRLKVSVQTGLTVTGIAKDPGGFRISLSGTDPLTVDRLVLCCGGTAAPQFGSSGDGLAWAKTLGHTVTPLYPALAPVEVPAPWIKTLMGSALPVGVSVRLDGRIMARDRGDLLFTHYGVSGPVILGLSRAVGPLLDRGKVDLVLDLLPDLSPEEAGRELSRRLSEGGHQSVRNCLQGLLPRKVLSVLLPLCRVTPESKASRTQAPARQRLTEGLKTIVLSPVRLRPLTDAQVTAGGVDTSEITETMASKIVPGLYFAGEIVDVDGDSGGFNLQWAWSSGAVAGRSAAQRT